MSVNAGSAVAYLDLDSSKFVSGMKQAASQMQEFEREGATTTDRMTALGNVSQSVGSAMTKYLTVPLAGIGLASVKVASDFESGMSKVSALSGATGADLKMLEDKAREMGSTTKFSSTEASEALQYMALAGWDAEQMAAGLEPALKLAGAAGMDLAQTTDIVTDTMSMFGMEASQATQMTDMLAYAQANSNTDVSQLGEALKYCGASANAMGYDLADTTALLGTFADQGLKGSSAGTTLNAMFRDMKKNSEDGAIAIGKKNVAIVDANGNYRDMNDILADVEKATEGMTQAEKDMALSSIWGTEALKGVNMALEAGTPKIKEFEEGIRNSDGAAAEMYETMQDNLKGAIDNFKSALEGAGITIGNILIPHIRNLVEKLTDCLTWFNNLDEGTQNVIVGFGAVVAAIGPLLLVFGTVLTMIPNLVAGWGILTGAVAGFTLAIPLAIAAIVGIVSAVGSSTNALQFLQDKFGTVGYIIGGICEFIYGLVQLTFGNIAIIIETAGKMIGAIMKGQFWKIDDIAREGWAKVENNTAEAMSNINMETSRGLREISNLSEKELKQVESVFDTSLSKLPTLTKHNIGGAAKEFTTSLKGMSDEGLMVLRGTSDTMAIVLEGISADMIGTEKGTKKMEANLESLAVSGGISAKDLESEVSGAMKTISNNVVDEGERIKQNATDVFNAFKTVGVPSVQDMANNVSQSIWQMGEGTVADLSAMGSTWGSILSGIKDDGSMTTQQMSAAIIANLSSMGITGEQLISQLRTESSKHMKDMEKDASTSAKTTKDNVTKEFKEAEKNATTSTKNTKDKVSKDMKETSKNVETESKKVNKSLTDETKKGADAVSKNMNKASKDAEKEAKNISKNVETETKKSSKAMADETKKGADSVKTNMSNASKDAQTEAKNISKNVDTEMKNSTKSIQQEATNMYNGVKTSFSKMSQISKQETTNMYKGVQTSFKSMESSAKNSATSMYKGVSTSFKSMANSAISDWNRIKSALRSPITGTVKVKVEGVQAALNQINQIKNAAKTNMPIPEYGQGAETYIPRYTEGDLQNSLYSMMPSASSYANNDVNINVRTIENEKKNKDEESNKLEINLNIENFNNERKQDVNQLMDEIAFIAKRKALLR